MYVLVVAHAMSLRAQLDACDLVCADRGRPCALENNEIDRVLRDTWKNLTLRRAHEPTMNPV